MLASDHKHRSATTEYGRQLREKQKIRYTYGIRENQFAGYVIEAREAGVNPTEALYQSLERRLDNVVFRLGFASARALARQMVSHGHVTVNGRRVTIPSYRVEVGDTVAIREGSKATKLAEAIRRSVESQKTPVWLSLDGAALAGKVTGKPSKNAESDAFDLPSIIELYARS